MINAASKFTAARAELEKAEENLGDPGRLRQLRNVIHFLLREISEDSPQIERDLAKKLLLRLRHKVLSEAKVVLASPESYEPEFIAHWNSVMEVFVDTWLADDPEFVACKQHLLAQRGSQPEDRREAAEVEIPKKEPQVAGRQDGPRLSIVKDVPATLHAKSLTGIGQSLEMIRLRSFSLEKQGDYYIIRSESLTATHEWILRNNLAEKTFDSTAADPNRTQLTVGDGWLCFGPLDIARLNARERTTGDRHQLAQPREAERLAQLLRTLGEHLDSKGATAFTISWAADSVSVEYQTANGVVERKNFTVEKLQQLASCSRFRRPSHRTAIASR